MFYVYGRVNWSKMLSKDCNTTNSVNVQCRLASIMEVLSKTAVAEITKVFDDGFLLLRLEMCRKDAKIDSLKRKLIALEGDLRSTRRTSDSEPPPSCQEVADCERKHDEGKTSCTTLHYYIVAFYLLQTNDIWT